MKTIKFIILIGLSFASFQDTCALPITYDSFIGKKLRSSKIYCINTLFLYPNGRFDEYGCEMETYYFGHYWVERDTLFLETFCDNFCHEEHNCFEFRTDAYIVENDSLVWVKFWHGDGAFGNVLREGKIEHRICWGLWTG